MRLSCLTESRISWILSGRRSTKPRSSLNSIVTLRPKKRLLKCPSLYQLPSWCSRKNPRIPKRFNWILLWKLMKKSNLNLLRYRSSKTCSYKRKMTWMMTRCRESMRTMERTSRRRKPGEQPKLSRKPSKPRFLKVLRISILDLIQIIHQVKRKKRPKCLRVPRYK